VCPQLAAEEAGRAANLTREQAALLANQAEDCLTLNIYVPHQAEGKFFTYIYIIGL
jgi:carboxylesterase type B